MPIDQAIMGDHSAMINLTWPNHGQMFLDKIWNYFQTQYQADIEFVCRDGYVLRAHRLVLSIFCPKLMAILDSEADPSSITEQIEHMDTLMEFIYRGKVTIPWDRLEGLHNAVKVLGISGLTDVGETEEPSEIHVKSEPASNHIPPDINFTTHEKANDCAAIGGAPQVSPSISNNSTAISSPVNVNQESSQFQHGHLESLPTSLPGSTSGPVDHSEGLVTKNFGHQSTSKKSSISVYQPNLELMANVHIMDSGGSELSTHLQCLECDFRCVTTQRLKNHVINKHGPGGRGGSATSPNRNGYFENEGNKTRKKKYFNCDVCGKRFTAKHSMKIHSEIHFANSKRFVCSMCGSRFRRKYTLNVHVRNIHSRSASSISGHMPATVLTRSNQTWELSSTREDSTPNL